MKPLFTIHAGEFLVASYIEHHFKDYLVWLPSRDSGVDLLLTDKHCKKAASIQVKFSRDFLSTHMADALRPGLKACGWFTLKPQKLSHSTANLWVFVLYPFNQKELDFVIIPPSIAHDIVTSLHGRQKTVQSYIWVTKKKQCWEARGLNRRDQLLIANNSYKNPTRDLTPYLNNWSPVTAELGPNQAMERTATRRAFTFPVASAPPLQATPRSRWPSLILFSLDAAVMIYLMHRTQARFR